MVTRADKSKNGARWRAAMLMVAAVSAMAATLGAAGGAAMASARAEQRPPLGRVWASWAYDPAQHNIVLFGGDSGYQSGPDVVFGKTWTWNGARWTRRHPAASPSARTGAAGVPSRLSSVRRPSSFRAGSAFLWGRCRGKRRSH
jgi:hypothetical protein